MLYTQTSLFLVYNLERVSKSLHCYFATYEFGIVAWLRLEPKKLLYQTILTTPSLLFWTGCSGSRAALWVVHAICCFTAPWSCLCSSWFAPWSWWPPDVAVAACWTCSFGWGYGNDAATPCSSDYALRWELLCIFKSPPSRLIWSQTNPRDVQAEFERCFCHIVIVLSPLPSYFSTKPLVKYMLL